MFTFYFLISKYLIYLFHTDYIGPVNGGPQCTNAADFSFQQDIKGNNTLFDDVK